LLEDVLYRWKDQDARRRTGADVYLVAGNGNHGEHSRRNANVA
jgi:hypothetical protein